MDHLEKGKQLAREGNYEEALDAFLLALENDKENADIHFYIGHCYSSMEEFGYAKFHYQVAQSLDPNNPKLNIIWDTIKNVEAQKPPERKLTRAAAAKERRSQTQQTQTEEEQQEDQSSETQQEQYERKIKLTEDKWERAFPADHMVKDEDNSKFFVNFLIFLILFALVGVVLFFVLQFFEIV